jgi:mannose-6-phosphate isomerase-like protein (cupin superfamily)
MLSSSHALCDGQWAAVRARAGYSGRMKGFAVMTADAQVFEKPTWNPDEPTRTLIELRRYANLRHSQANLWRYPPGAHGRRHREPLQEEVFLVVEGVLTLFLGDPSERFELPARSIAVVEPGTPLQLRNESEVDVLVFAYGAPEQPAEYEAQILPDAR